MSSEHENDRTTDQAAGRLGEDAGHEQATADTTAHDRGAGAGNDATATGPATAGATAGDPATADAAAGDPATAGATATDVPADETPRQRRRREKAAKPRRKAPWWEIPLLVAVAVGVAILLKSFVVGVFFIPSDSMEKTLHGCPGCSGDRILVNKPIYSMIRDPEPGDIVVFNIPPGWQDESKTTPPSNPVVKAVRGFGQLIGFVPPDNEVLVKRVIAVGGQTVKGDAQGHVMISTKGKAGPYRTLNEPYVYAPKSQGPQTAFAPVTVPKDRLWVMGDHRTDSADSRYHCTPDAQTTQDDDNCNATSATVPVDNVIGKAFVIAWPPSRWTTLGTPSTFEGAAALAGPGLPAVASLGVVAPVALVRRRRRRR